LARDGSGIYSKPVGTEAIPNDPITSSQFNTTVDDFVEDANTPRPISAGGTAASTTAQARANLDVAQQVDSIADFTEDRGLIVGSGGLLAGALAHAVTNINDLVTGRNWNIADPSGISNLPVANAGILTVEARASNRFVQTFRTTPTGNRMFQRSYNGTVWTAWAEVVMTAEAGTVSGGTYEKFSDGRMVVRRTASIPLTAINDSWLGGFRSAAVSFNFGETFVSAPDVMLTAAGNAHSVGISSITTTAVLVRFFAPASQAADTLTVAIRAEGRWV
jgi:hypothetical protein